jgi:hypothetical protein
MSPRTPARRLSAATTALLAVGARPRLWGVSITTLRRLAPSGWWRRYPFLPVPDAAYWRFRMQTAYGTEWKGRPTKDDVVDYLAWCQRTRPPHR